MNIAPDRYTFGALARILDQEQIRAISKDFLRAIKSKTDPVDLYFEVLSDARNLDEARIVLAQMVEAGHRVRPAHVSALASRVGSLQELVALLDQFGIDNTAVTAGAVAFAISRAGSYGDARVALSLMQEIKIAPTAAPYAAMLGHCASFDEGRDSEIDAPFSLCCTRFLCCRRDGASCRISGGRILGYTLSFRLSVLVGVRFFSRMVYRLAKIVDANELLNWVFTRGVKFPTKALASAVAGYVEDGREEDAMRIVMPFPHFEESVEVYCSPFSKRLLRELRG